MSRAPGSVAEGERPAPRSEPDALHPLTPYQARLDVEMDDTAVSRVRDPSASFRLGPDGDLIETVTRPSPTPAPGSRSTAAASVVWGAVFGALVVTLVVVLVRWLSH